MPFYGPVTGWEESKMPEEVTITAYHFRELQGKAREKARRWLEEVYHEADTEAIHCRLDTLTGDISEKTGIDLEVEDFSYSIGGRGDFLGVDARRVAYALSQDGVEVSLLPRRVGVWFSEFPFMGVQETETDALLYSWDQELTEEEQKRIQEDIERRFSEMVSLIREAFSDMKDRVFYNPSDEELEELAEVNEWLFLEDGSLAPV